MSAPTDSPDPITRHFLRFRDTGDPGAMAEVFDATAPKLLLLAMHLVRDGALAEDLVQTTFVQAIERCEAFDGRFPSVWAWLTQILRRRAVDLHRAEQREQRHREHGAPGWDSPLVEDPSVLLEAAEAADALRDAIDALPSHYRSVLIMRVLHDMEPRQIAYALGTSPGTVRSRIKRGLDLVRRRIAPTAALPAALVAWSPRGLAEVRSAVLARAAGVRPPLVEPSGWPSWAMPAAAAVALLVPALMLLDASEGPRPAVPAAEARGAAGVAEPTTAAVLAGAATRLPVTHVPAPGGGARVVEVVWARDRSPARGVAVFVRRVDLQVGACELSLRTDADGTADLAGVPPGSYELFRSPCDRTVVELPEGAFRTRLEIASHAVRGRVRHADGRAVAAGQIRLWTGSGPEGRDAARLAGDGSFRLEHVTPGQRVACRLPDGRWTGAVRIDESAEAEVSVVLEVPAECVPIRGRLTTPGGRAVAGARIAAVPAAAARSWPHPWLEARADEAGRFTLLLPRIAGETRISIDADGCAAGRIDVDRLGPPDELRIELLPGLELIGTVTDARGEFATCVYVQVGAGGETLRRTLTDGRGQFRVGGLAPGRYAVFVDAGRAGVCDREVELTHGGQPRLAFEVQPIRRVSGRIVDRGGRPAAGVFVRARRVDGEVTGWQVVTDQRGEFEISFRIPALHQIALSWRAAAPPFAVHSGPFVDGDRVLLSLADAEARRPSAWVEGRLAEWPGAVELCQPATSWTRPLLPLEDGRSFRVGPLPPGDYEIRSGELPIRFRLQRGERLDLGEI